MADVLHGGDLVRYARQAVADGYALIDVHTADRIGLCRSCGREAPCPDSRRGTELIANYRPWARDTERARRP